MGILAWLLFGLIAGFVANKIMHGGLGLVGDIVVGILGAFLGGWVTATMTGKSVTAGFDIVSFLVAILGACLLIFIVRLVTKGRTRA